MKDSWKPAWVVQGRQPSFVGPAIASKFGTPKYLWGNMPAIDIVRLANHEGETFLGPLNLLFAGKRASLPFSLPPLTSLTAYIY